MTTDSGSSHGVNCVGSDGRERRGRSDNATVATAGEDVEESAAGVAIENSYYR